MRKIILFSILCLFSINNVFAITPLEPGVYFANLRDGQKVKSPLTVEMQLVGKQLKPAGDPTPNSGHHHIIIDSGFIEQGKVIPADEKHIHFGQAQTSALINLAPGKHKITLQLADAFHLSYGEKWAKSITVEVEE